MPVGTLVARGDVELGFQQLIELMNLPSIDVLGPLPGEIQIVTRSSADLAATSTQAQAVRELFGFLVSPEVAEIKRRDGMGPAS